MEKVPSICDDQFDSLQGFQKSMSEYITKVFTQMEKTFVAQFRDAHEEIDELRSKLAITTSLAN